jgi:hypothetical protein
MYSASSLTPHSADTCGLEFTQAIITEGIVRIAIRPKSPMMLPTTTGALRQPVTGQAPANQLDVSITYKHLLNRDAIGICMRLVKVLKHFRADKQRLGRIQYNPHLHSLLLSAATSNSVTLISDWRFHAATIKSLKCGNPVFGSNISAWSTTKGENESLTAW